MSFAPKATPVTKATFGLPSDAIEYLKLESQRRGVSMADVVRQAIATHQYLRDKTSQGADLVIEEKGQRPSKLVIR